MAETLNLSTLVDMPNIGVEIDGTFYAYAPHWRWSLIERSRFSVLYGDMLEVERIKEPTVKDQKRFTDLQVTLCRIVCPELPEEIIRALPSDNQRSALIIDFLTKSGNQANELIPKEHAALLSLVHMATRQTGASSSPDSKPPTAATRRRGSTSPILS